MNNAVYEHFIEGEQIYLREVRREDVNENYYKWMNDHEITRYTESRYYPYSMEQLQAFVTSLDGKRNDVFLAIIEKATDKHVGNIKLGDINWIHRRGDIGVIIGEKSCWGKGYASEAIALLSSYAFSKLNLYKVCSGCYANNIGSIKAFKKAGFAEEAVLKRHYYYAGEYIDVVLLGKFNGEA
ncbi:MAG: GNAT family N-acetyltransferase [Syntrophomonadaceae bacterium]|nr:GNAT family N-acetyltransferase [Syntrophomonadaceae bacterium]